MNLLAVRVRAHSVPNHWVLILFSAVFLASGCGGGGGNSSGGSSSGGSSSSGGAGSGTTAPSNVPNNRTDYASTEGTPYGAVYDSLHNLVFASNPAWNRVDVISGISHSIVKSVPILSPQGIDITQDNSYVWVTTSSQRVFRISTTTFAATAYALPNFVPPSGYFGTTSWMGYRIYALADGTLMLTFAPSNCCRYLYAAVWDPVSSAFTQLTLPSPYLVGGFFILRTGSGNRICL